MTSHEALTHFAGFDVAKDHHDIIIIDAKGQVVAEAVAALRQARHDCVVIRDALGK